MPRPRIGGPRFLISILCAADTISYFSCPYCPHIYIYIYLEESRPDVSRVRCCSSSLVYCPARCNPGRTPSANISWIRNYSSPHDTQLAACLLPHCQGKARQGKAGFEVLYSYPFEFDRHKASQEMRQRCVCDPIEKNSPLYSPIIPEVFFFNREREKRYPSREKTADMSEYFLCRMRKYVGEKGTR